MRQIVQAGVIPSAARDPLCKRGGDPSPSTRLRMTRNAKLPRMIVRIAALLLLAQSAIAAAVAPSEYQARRDRLANQLGPNAMLIVFSAKTKARDMDIDYPYRQSD